MIKQVKSGLKFALRPAARMLTARQPKILMYHRFSQDESGHATPVDLFRRQVELLKKEFTILTLRDIVRLDGSNRMRTFRNVVARFRLLRSDATARTHSGPT